MFAIYSNIFNFQCWKNFLSQTLRFPFVSLNKIWPIAEGIHEEVWKLFFFWKIIKIVINDEGEIFSTIVATLLV